MSTCVTKDIKNTYRPDGVLVLNVGGPGLNLVLLPTMDEGLTFFMTGFSLTDWCSW